MNSLPSARRSVRFENSKQMKAKFHRDMKSPSIEGQSVKTPCFPETEDRVEMCRFMEAAARPKAIKMYNQAWGTKLNIQSARESLFVEGTKPMTATTPSVGTDCSGIDTPLLALDNMEVSYVHKFSCENDPVARETIQQNFTPQILYDDIKE